MSTKKHFNDNRRDGLFACAVPFTVIGVAYGLLSVAMAWEGTSWLGLYWHYVRVSIGVPAAYFLVVCSWIYLVLPKKKDRYSR